MAIGENDPRSQLSLPPGFRFFPTDEELLVQYLCRKVAGHHFPLPIIGDVDLYKFEPWDLPSKALFGEKEWYFFSPRDRKYPNGSRPNRVACSGYWKATGTDKIITTEGRKVGIKKALVFYVGKAPKGTKTNWIMHEYRLSESPRKSGGSRLDDWVLCRIYKKNTGGRNPSDIPGVQSKDYSHDSSSSCSSQYDDVMDSLPEIDDRFFSLPGMDSLKNLNFRQDEDQKVNLLQRLGSANFDWATLGGLTSIGPEYGQAQLQQTNMNSGNDMYAPASVMDEAHSGFGNQRVQNSGFFSNTPTGSTQGFSGSIDPFSVRYPTDGLGFRQ
ncbi:hypothetical protein ACS0TY_016971 [Phlomoides rotata]